ncbi:MAG: cytochrome c3 family protein [Desulfobacterales bacterium]|nr:cytochrome c3 family protein [Desulfobacterales bacterium]
MKRLFFGIIFILLIVAAPHTLQAKVTGRCDNCHTMHNSQGGQAMAYELSGGSFSSRDTPYNTLLITDCVGCHTALDGTTWKDSTTGAPIVYNTKEPSQYLAGGNFYWVAQAGGDAKGHNVLGIAATDTTLSEAPGNVNLCGNSCHCSLATTAYNSPGCCGCHLNPAHHADDTGPIVGAASPSTDGYYRFLSGHMSGDEHGVCGIEDNDWQHTADLNDHNEYLGWEEHLEWPVGFYNMGHTMTAFCCGCHGNFHVEQDSSGNWLRHPSDAVIPNSGEYASAFGVSHFYDPTIPVARPILTAVTDTVAIGTDLVMCLSCHRPHGSPYYKMMRWDYKNWPGGGDDGCSTCHTSKN